MTRTRYRKRPDQFVVAVRLALDFDGLTYRKWGDDQECKPGDWLIENDGDVYTVDADAFAASYERTARGRYVKTAPVWAVRADAAGEISTREGSTRYAAGDYLVSNRADGSDDYAVSREKFESMYERVDEPADGTDR